MNPTIFLFYFLAITASAQQPTVVPLLSNIPSSIRGLSVVNDDVAWFSGSKGHVGRTINGGKSWQFSQIKLFEKVDFRSLYAFDSMRAIVANAGSPASILLTTDGGKNWREVYHNEHADIFLDGIDFWDERTGVIYGDPINGKMMLLKTLDGGETWKEIPEGQRPTLENEEASFAASGTGIRCIGKNKMVIATGGMVSRLWVSTDRGERWASTPTPIVQGRNSAGIFSVGVEGKQWVIVGGDYLADSLSIKNSFYSGDEGKTWNAPMNSTRGYRSAVEFIDGKTWIAVGQGGLDISSDHGKNWMPLNDEKGLHTIRKARKGKMVLAAGNGRVVLVPNDLILQIKGREINNLLSTQTTNQMTSYEYVDGNGSTYSITPTSLEFMPIPAKESSTGFFNAGEPYKVKIDKKEFETLKQVFEKSITNKNGQTEQRGKGTGKLIVLPEAVYIFEMNSLQKMEIEAAIKVATKE